MKLGAILGPLEDLRYATFAAVGPTLKILIKKPSIIFRPKQLSQLFFSHVWALFGSLIDAGSKGEKTRLIKDVHGIVLDIGAGHGHTLDYLQVKELDVYIAIEPNELMHTHIAQRAQKLGVGRYIILTQGAEDILGIKAALRQHNINQVDTIVSVLTFCSIPSPYTTLPTLVKNLLKPGGQMLFYEHVLSPRPDVAYWQRIWSPIWSSFFDGCRLDVPTHTIVASIRNDDGSDFWKEGSVWSKEDEPDEHLFWHRTGRYVRA